jgi:hypothetical protein
MSPAIANDLLNANAAELATALVGAGAILFALQHNHASAISAQTGRLATFLTSNQEFAHFYTSG